MIPVINKGPSFKGLIAYNEKKVETGEARLLFNNTLGCDAKGYNADFINTVQMKKNVKNPTVHIVLSFAKEDKLSPEKLLDISQEYLQGMGYGQSPYLVYQHFDTDHEHVHIITSRVDYEGKLIDGHKDFHTSLELSRLIEEKHNLHKVVYRSGAAELIGEKNAQKYAFEKGLKKAISDPALRGLVQPRVITELTDLFAQGQSVSNSKAEKLYAMKGLSNEFMELNKFLQENGLIKRLDKDLLIDQIKNLKKTSVSFQDFQDRALQAGMYVRVFPGKQEIVLGFKEKSFYLKDKQLPKSLRYLSLIQIGKIKTEFSKEEQKKFLSFHIRKNLKYSYRLEDFVNRLNMKGIETEVRQDARGIYGLSFRNITIPDGEKFKASDLGDRKEFSVEKVLSTLSQNAAKNPTAALPRYKEFIPTSYPVNLRKLAKSLDEKDSEDQADELKRSRGYGI